MYLECIRFVAVSESVRVLVHVCKVGCVLGNIYVYGECIGNCGESRLE